MTSRLSVGVALASLVAFLLLAACQGSDNSRCSSYICPAGSQCVDDPDIICVLPDQLDACRGEDDFLTCSFVGANEGYCLREICRPIVCGNGVLDPGEACDDDNTDALDSCSPSCNSDYSCGNGVTDREVGEVCDDGNLEGGDGCSPACSSERCGNQIVDEALGEECDGTPECGPTCLVQACGNGFIDTPRGEVCDDGNLRSGDGCSSICSNETSSWTPVETLLPEFKRTDSAMVYDANRDRIVLFGGLRDKGEFMADTWEYDGSRWFRLDMVVAPPARANHAMAYDSTRGQVVLFGGRGEDGLLSDTWEFDGLLWRKINVTGPAPRQDHRMVFDERQSGVFLHGGNKTLQDSWTFDGNVWTVHVPGAGDPPDFPLQVPPALSKFGMAYDSDREVVMLFGGVLAGTPTNEHWEFSLVNGEDIWRQIPSSEVIPPEGRNGHTLVYDRERSLMLMFGGRLASDSAKATNDTEILQGGIWSSNGAPSPPPARQEALAAYDALRGQMVLVGGFLDLEDLPPEDEDAEVVTWKFTTAVWTPDIPAESAPSHRHDMMWSYDTTRNRLLLFGGIIDDNSSEEDNQEVSDTWEFDGHQWRVRAPSLSPPARSAGAMSYDEDLDHSVLFGGIAGGAVLADTWILDDSNWSELALSTAPAARKYASMSYDKGRDRVVLFGGELAGGFLSDETWIFDGQAWTEMSFAVDAEVPSPRSRASMTYDPDRDRLVLFGGRSEVGEGLADTWEFDGTAWYAVNTTQQPPPRLGHAISYIRSASSVILHAGYVGGANTTNLVNDTWSYVGTEWTPLASVPSTDLVGDHLFSDSPRGAFVFGGSRVSPFPGSSAWGHEFVSPLADEQCVAPGDEDGDSLSNCEDPDCEDSICGTNNLTCIDNSCQCPSGLTEESNCSDHVDDDCDGLIDCQDTDGCALDAICQAESDCADLLDNDSDGLSDCADPGCAGVFPCEDIEALCEDDLDNDGDGLKDCEDPSCSLSVSC